MPVSRLSFHEKPINNIAWSPQSPFLICSISQDNHAYLWNVESIGVQRALPILEYFSETPMSNIEWCQN